MFSVSTLGSAVDSGMILGA